MPEIEGPVLANGWKKFEAGTGIGAVRSGEVHAWLCRRPCNYRPDNDIVLLTLDERRRAAKFRTLPLRAAFVFAHASLHRILAEHLGCGADEIQLSYAGSGKPYAVHPGNIAFNLSHSGDAVLIAVSSAEAIGVDVEAIMPEPPHEVAIAAFSMSERAHLRKCAGDDYNQAFYRFWTRKEAVAKGIGLGLSLDLRAVDVGIGSGPGQVSLPVHSKMQCWHFSELPHIPDYASALATPHLPLRILAREYCAGHAGCFPRAETLAI